MHRFVLFALFFALSNVSSAYNHIINVSIYGGTVIRESKIIIIEGTYQLKSDKGSLYTLTKGKTCTFKEANNKVSVVCDSLVFESTLSISLVANGTDCVFRLEPVGKGRKRTYDDNLTVGAGNKQLNFINNVGIEKYVAGVVEAEAGIMKNTEFYKVQSVACRTYVLRNIRRHAHEGFHVCDKVHCQVYNGKCYNKDILDATKQTEHFVIIDKELNFISAVFHSNCGGQTVNSEDVWTLPSSYLISIRDTFCVKSKNANWEKRIKKDCFLNYLKANYNYPVHDSVMSQNACLFSQTNGRRVYFADQKNIHLKEIRDDWNLKSTYFSITDEGTTLLFKGKGFGHGVGLCQEGAMEMINQGYCYDDIIKFYYTNVYIVSYEDILKLNK